jgi:two-component sensor histidine kinase
MDQSDARSPIGKVWRAPVAPHLRSVRHGLILLMLLSLLPVTLVFFVQGLVRIEQRRADTGAQMAATAMIVARVADSVLTEKIRLLHAVALHPAVAALGPECAVTLRDSQPMVAPRARFIRLSADARPLCDTLPDTAQSAADPVYAVQSSTRAESAWWQRLRGGQDVVAIVPAMADAPPVLRLAVPVVDSAGRFAGALVVREDAAWLTRRLGAPPGAAGGIAIIDDAGNTLVSSRKLPVLAQMQSQTGSGSMRDSSGVRWLYRVAPLRAAAPGQPGLRVAYAIPQPPTVLWQNAVDFLLPIIAILAASVAIWIGTERLVLRWLRNLQRLALQFAGGGSRRKTARFTEAPREFRSGAAALYRSAIMVDDRDKRVRDALARQRLLTRELHHRVRNNLQMVLSLLSLQSSRLEDATARGAIDKARSRVGALALVHRQLYDGDELSGISSRSLLGALCTELQAQAGGPPGPTLDCDFDDVTIDVDTAMPLALWLVEAVGNALSHGFPDARPGRIAAELRVDGAAAILRVIDDGIGFDPVTPATGHGLRLISAIAAQLGGKASVSSGKDGGSEASLVFELRQRTERLEPAGA